MNVLTAKLVVPGTRSDLKAVVCENAHSMSHRDSAMSRYRQMSDGAIGQYCVSGPHSRRTRRDVLHIGSYGHAADAREGWHDAGIGYRVRGRVPGRLHRFREYDGRPRDFALGLECLCSSTGFIDGRLALVLRQGPLL